MNKKITFILKNSGDNCNLQCIYCSEIRKNHQLEKRIIDLKEIDKLLEMTKGYGLVILFHGGEPMLLSPSYYDKIIERCKADRRDVTFGIQTNTTLIDESWVEFIIKHKGELGVSISLDGDCESNKNRVTRDKKEVYDTIIEQLRLLEKHDIPVGVVSTITKNSFHHEQENMDLYNTFTNIHHVQLNPCFDIFDGGNIPEWGINPKEYFDFVRNIFIIWIKQADYNKLLIEPIISVLNLLSDVKAHSCVFSDEKCNNFFTVYPDGELLSCDTYTFHEGYLGNIYNYETISEVMDLKTNSELNQQYKELLSDCNICAIKSYCNGGCIAARMRYKKNYQKDSNIYCDSMKEFVAYIQDVYSKFIKS